MEWRQYDNLYDDLKNAAFKASLAPLFRKINSSKVLNNLGVLPKRIILCGSPRSGTTLMNELMRCYDSVYVMNREEPALRFPYIITRKKFIVTKYPLDYRNFEKIIDVFGEPYILFMLRDPRDVIVSKHYKLNNNYLVNFPVWLEAIQAFEKINYANKLLIRYEDLTRTPGIVQDKIMRKIGLSSIKDFESFYTNVDGRHQDIKSLGGVRPIDPKNNGKYLEEEHRLRIQKQIQSYPELTEWVIKYGYDKDRAWEKIFLD